MAFTLQDVVDAVKEIRIERKKGDVRLAQRLCGKYKGAIPKGVNSTRFIRQELRGKLYGKFESDS